MSKYTIKIIIACLLMSVFPVDVFSCINCIEDTLENHSINEVKVVANIHREIIQPQRLTGLHLQRMSTSSVADAVRYFSGVQIKDYGGVGGLKTVDIRSMGSNHLGVFYDGVPVGNAQNGTVDLGRFSLDNIDEVSVYNGQKSEIFQSARDFGSSGSLYLKTRRPVFDIGKSYNVNTKFSTGSFGLVNPSVLYEHKFTDKLSLSFNTEYLKANGRYKFRCHKLWVNDQGNIVASWDTTGIRNNGDVESSRIECSVWGNMNKGQWNAKAYYYKSEKGIPRAIVRNVWTSSQRQWDKNIFVQSNAICHLNDVYSTKMALKYSFDQMRYLNPDTTSLYVDNRFDQYAFYSSIANKWNIIGRDDSNNMSLYADLSVDYEWNALTSNMKNFVDPERHVVLAAFALALDIKYVKAQTSLLGNYIHDVAYSSFMHNSMLSKWTRKYTPSFFFSYLPFACSSTQLKNIKARTFYKKMFRMPTFNDLYYTDIGNVSLNPEYATQFDIGVGAEYYYGCLVFSFNIDGYHNKIDDKIIAVPKGNSQYRWMMMNIGKVDIKGFDTSINASLDLCGVLYSSLRVNYTYQKALDVTDPSDIGEGGTYKGQISYVPKHSGSVVVDVCCGGLCLNYSYIYIGERYHVSANIPQNHEPSWYTHDIKLTKNIYVNKKFDLSMGVEFNNLFNQQYDVVMNYPMPGRNYKFILNVNI